MTAMERAFAKIGLRPQKRVVRKSWPRLHGPRALRIEVKTGYLVAVLPRGMEVGR